MVDISQSCQADMGGSGDLGPGSAPFLAKDSGVESGNGLALEGRANAKVAQIARQVPSCLGKRRTYLRHRGKSLAEREGFSVFKGKHEILFA